MKFSDVSRITLGKRPVTRITFRGHVLYPLGYRLGKDFKAGSTLMTWHGVGDMPQAGDTVQILEKTSRILRVAELADGPYVTLEFGLRMPAPAGSPITRPRKEWVVTPLPNPWRLGERYDTPGYVTHEGVYYVVRNGHTATAENRPGTTMGINYWGRI